MASFLDDELNSSDSEDVDYIPGPAEVSSEDDVEDSTLPDDEIKTKKTTRKTKSPDSEGEEKKKFEESASTESKVDEKQRANDLFKSFLEEVEAEMKVKEPGISSENIPDSPALASGSNIKSDEAPNENKPKKSSTELFEFAGETVAVSEEGGTKIISKVSELEKNKPINLGESASNKPASQPTVMKRKGLQSVLDSIMDKKQKLTTLEKTSLDWKSFKKEHGISEELETFNKGRGGYVERQRFLQRSDVRSFEIERDMRLAKRKKD